MDDLVNTLAHIYQEIEGAGIALNLEGERLRLTGPNGSSCLHIVRLYRPSSDDVRREASPDVLLVLTAPTARALLAAARHNHIAVPGHNYRIIAPGIVLIHDAPAPQVYASRQVRLMGRTGVIVESLLLGGRREWSIRDLAAASKVTPALAYRAVVRLERESLLVRRGSGPTTIRTVANLRALAELWSQEDMLPKPFHRGFLYGSSPEALARKVVEACPGGAVGGALAANLYRSVLTRVPLPVQIWAPGDFAPQALEAIGFQPTESGVNVELIQAKGDPWRVHMQHDGLPRVSKWRAWREIANAEGRTQELAEAMLSDLEG